MEDAYLYEAKLSGQHHTTKLANIVLPKVCKSEKGINPEVAINPLREFRKVRRDKREENPSSLVSRPYSTFCEL